MLERREDSVLRDARSKFQEQIQLGKTSNPCGIAPYLRPRVDVMSHLPFRKIPMIGSLKFSGTTWDRSIDQGKSTGGPLKSDHGNIQLISCVVIISKIVSDGLLVGTLMVIGRKSQVFHVLKVNAGKYR